MHNKTFLFLFCFLPLAFFLIGCGANIERNVTFYADEAWAADMEFGIPGELVAMMGSIDDLEANITESVAAWEAQGADVSWKSSREETTLIYSFQIEGTGWDLLNEVIFEDRAEIFAEEVEGERQIHFSYFVSGDLLDANQNILTLNGGEIISSNGQQLSDGQVQWLNASGRVEAVLTEKGRFGFTAVLLIVLLLGAAGVGFWYFWQQSNQTKPQMQPAVMSTAFCANCGTQLSSQAKFCPSCGQQQA